MDGWRGCSVRVGAATGTRESNEAVGGGVSVTPVSPQELARKVAVIGSIGSTEFPADEER